MKDDYTVDDIQVLEGLEAVSIRRTRSCKKKTRYV